MKWCPEPCRSACRGFGPSDFPGFSHLFSRRTRASPQIPYFIFRGGLVDPLLCMFNEGLLRPLARAQKVLSIHPLAATD